MCASTTLSPELCVVLPPPAAVSADGDKQQGCDPADEGVWKRVDAAEDFLDLRTVEETVKCFTRKPSFVSFFAENKKSRLRGV